MSDSTVNFGLAPDEKERLRAKAERMGTSISFIMQSAVPLLLALDEDPGWSSRFISHVSSTLTDSLFSDNRPDAVTVAAPVNKRLADDFAAQVTEDGYFQYPAHAIARALLLYALPAVVTEVEARLKSDAPSKKNVQGMEEILDAHRYCYEEVRDAIDELRLKADDASKRLDKWDEDFVQAGKTAGGNWAKGIEVWLQYREAAKRMGLLSGQPTKKSRKS